MREGWQIRKLGDACSLVNRGVSPAYLEKGGVCVLNQKCIRNHEVNYEAARRHDDAAKKVAEERFIQLGDVLVNSTGTGTLGRVAQVRNEPEEATTVDSHVTIVRPKPGLFHLDFFGYMLIVIEEAIKEAGDGCGGQTELARSVLAERFTVSYPESLVEQQRIVALLDEAFAGLATAKANAERNLQNARALFESGLDSAITGKLTWEWRHRHTKNGNASADLAGRLAARREQWTGTGLYREPITPVTLKAINVPDGWVLASPEQITSHIVDCPHSTPKWAESGEVCLRTTNFKPGFLDLESVRFVSPQTYNERIMRLEPQPGDVLYSREGGILGIACMIPAKLKTCLGQRMMLFRTDSAVVLPEYFAAVLNSTLILSEVKRLTGGAASPHLNICDIRSFPIPLPPITEQLQIVAKLNTIAAEAQRLTRLYERKLAALEELKKSLLHQAFNGEL